MTQPATKMCAFAKRDDRISQICVNSGNIVLAHTLNILAKFSGIKHLSSSLLAHKPQRVISLDNVIHSNILPILWEFESFSQKSDLVLK